ncbi:hypothetical protein B566_EDAN003152 [Ephemera danica]|nr:hypothetical protein B566_EDAN003152 [Ephemera danica]
MRDAGVTGPALLWLHRSSRATTEITGENYSATSATINDPLALQLEVLQVSRDCVSRVVEDGQELLQSARAWLASQSSQQQEKDTAVSDTAHKSNRPSSSQQSTQSSTNRTTQTSTRNPKTASNLYKQTTSSNSKRTVPESTKRTASENTNRTAPYTKKSVSISSQSPRTTRDANKTISSERTASSCEQPSEASTQTRGTQTARNSNSARPMTARGQRLTPTMRIAPKYTQTQQKMLMRKPPTLNMNAARRLQMFPPRGNSSAPPRLTGRFCMTHVSTQTEVTSEGPAEQPATSRLARQDLQPLQIPRALVMQAGPCVGITPVPVEKRTNNMKSVSLARVTPPRPGQDCATQTSPVSRAAVVQTEETSPAHSQSVMTQTEPCQVATTGETQTDTPLHADTRVTKVKRLSLVAVRVIDLHVDQATVLTTAMQTDVESRGVAVQTQEQISHAVIMNEIGPGGDAPQPAPTGIPQQPETRNSPTLQLRPKSPIRVNIQCEERTPTPARDYLSPVTNKVDTPEMNTEHRAPSRHEVHTPVDRQSIIRERVAASPSLMEPLTIDTLPLLKLSAKKVLPWSLRRQELVSRNRLAGSTCSSSSISSLVTGTESCSEEVTDTASEAPTLCADLNAGSEGKGSVWSEGEVRVHGGYTSDAKGSLKSEGEVTMTSVGEVKHQSSQHSVGEVTGHTIPLVQRRRVLQLASRVAPHLLSSSKSFSEGEISEGQVVAQG